MLVLTRRTGQVINIAVPGVRNEIVVSVVSVRNGAARIGVVADPDIHIVRGELDGKEIRPGSRGDKFRPAVCDH